MEFDPHRIETEASASEGAIAIPPADESSLGDQGSLGDQDEHSISFDDNNRHDASLSEAASRVVTDVRLFDARDLPWIETFLDIVERSLDEPWRVLLERVEHALLVVGSRPVSPRLRRYIVFALRRFCGSRGERAKIARRVRASVLGHPALDRDARDARIAAAAEQLGIDPADVESLLWADLARERPVVLPRGRPAARALAAIANLDRLQGDMRRARELELRVWDDPQEEMTTLVGVANAAERDGANAAGSDGVVANVGVRRASANATSSAGDLVRMAARCGLVTRVTREDDALVLRIQGPLALFHKTTVYGRALGALVPLLADHERFELAMHCEFESGPRTLRVVPPALLPPYESRMKPSIAEKLAMDLERARFSVERDPVPIADGERVLFPDLAVEDRGVRWLVEVVGFSTAEYLADKLARYRAANQRAVLCVDTSRSKLVEVQPHVLPFQRRIAVDALVQIFEEVGAHTA